MVITEGRKLTPRAQRTREKLIQAATVVFPKLGFLDTRITDITAEAGTANGSFYNYFSSKEEIFRAVIEDVNDAMFEQSASRQSPSATPYQRIRASTEHYVNAYRTNAPLIAIFEQVATFSPEFIEMRRTTRQKFRDRIEGRIKIWQEEGLVDSTLSASCVSAALTSMVSNFCYMWLVVGEDHKETEVIETLSLMWARSLAIPVD